jgi:hypothetical protein
MSFNVSGAEMRNPLARLILGVFMISAVVMMALYARFGFEKILGLGHALWIPLLPVVVLGVPSAEGGFRTFLVVWAAATTISLIFDVVDVWKYFASKTEARSNRL